MIIFFGLLSLVLLTMLGASLFYLIRFARIIMIIEDDFSDAIEALEDTEKTLEKILAMRLFFDSKEVQIVVKEAMPFDPNKPRKKFSRGPRRERQEESEESFEEQSE